MSLSQPSLRRIGLFLFWAGILLAAALAALQTWADIEAISYGFPNVGHERMRGLDCPILMSRDETAAIEITLKNTTDQLVRPLVRAMVSAPGLARWREVAQSVPLQPGDRQTVAWEVGADDIVLNNFILVKGYTFAAYPMANTEGTCGSFVVNIGGVSGTVLYGLWLAVSVVLILSGLLLSRDRKAAVHQRAGRSPVRLAIAVAAAAGLASAHLAMWVVSVLALVVMLFLIPMLLMVGEK